MLNRIIHLSLNNRLVVLMASVLLMFAGMYTAEKMDVDVFPDLNAPTVVVMTEADGMAPEEVERLVSFPLETAVNGATDVRRVRSSSATGFSILWIEFNWGTDIYRARQIVSEKIATVKDQMPEGVGNPTLGPQSSILGEIMFVSLSSEKTSLQELRTIADWTVRPRLLATGGVAQVSVLGGDIKEYQILLDPGKMKHYGVTLNEVYSAVQDMNRNASGGILYEYGNEYIVRGMLSKNKIGLLGKAVIKTVGNVPVTLNNVADVKIGNRSPKIGTASVKGKPSVLMTITKQPSTSTVQLTDKLDAALADLAKSLPEDVHVSTDIYRQERFINNSINNVKKSLFEGALFVVIVLFVFLMNVRTTFISLITIPLSLLISVLILHVMGFTINTMSLGGMAIAIGSLVDDAIVDVENVYKRLRENRNLPTEKQRSVINVVFDASKEVRMPILNSTLIVVASFIPLFFLTGMEGRLLFPLGIAFISALCASTLVALTLTPVLCSYMLGRRNKGKLNNEQEPYVVRKIKAGYLKLLKINIKNYKIVLSCTGVVLIFTIVILSGMGRSFLPPFNEGSFTINVSTMPGISLEESDKIGRKVEKILLGIPEIKTVGRKTGRAELDEHALGVNNSELEVPYVLEGRTKAELLDDIRSKLEVIPGINVEVGAPISHRIDAMLSGTRANIAIKLFGTDLNKMYSLGNEIKYAISDVEGLADINVEQQVERPQLQIIPKEDMLAKYGITMPDFSRIVRIMMSGETVSQVYEGSKTFDLTLKSDDKFRNTADDIRNMVIDADGRKIPLMNIAEVKSSMGPNMINRENVSRKLVVSANVTERDLSGAVSDIRDIIEKEINLPEDYHIEYGGQFESEKAATRTLLTASVFAILAIFILLYHQFRNIKESLVVLINLPLALIGGVLVIWFGEGIISIPSIIGFISLFGIATRNGILLVSHYNSLREHGLSVYDSVIKGSADRLNPILMTALTSALALIPLVIGGDLPGNEIQSPMAAVILGGLFSSTILNGFVIPIMYILTNSKEQKETINRI